MFWEQSAALVQGERIWDRYRSAGGRVGMMFWQHSLGERVDWVLSPAPIHKHGGGMIQACQAEPPDLYTRLLRNLNGRSFNLMHYWGPLASRRSSDWIVDATLNVMEMDDAPGLLLSYIPHLDYDLQRYGPQSSAARLAFQTFLGYLAKIEAHAQLHGYDFIIYGDYAIEQVTGPAIFPNRRLREAGLFATREAGGMSYPDFFSGRAFAVADHQIAHIYGDPSAAEQARDVLRDLPGIRRILNRAEQKSMGLDHPRGGELVLIAEEGRWFAYPWWDDHDKAPDFASHVDIHNKPGYDPCELFFGWPPLSVSSDTSRVLGTHGRPGTNMDAAWRSSINFAVKPKTLIELAEVARQRLDASA